MQDLPLLWLKSPLLVLSVIKTENFVCNCLVTDLQLQQIFPIQLKFPKKKVKLNHYVFIFHI
jgi:hypothetical protein